MQWPRALEETEGRILHALNSHQIIEATLKAYPCRFLESNPNKPTSEYTTNKVKKETLGWPIKKFKAINTNSALHNTLDAIRGERNEIAHQALVAHSPEISKILGIDVMDIERLRQIDRRALKAMAAIVCEFIENQPRNLI